jgi:hypothetical protein
MRQKRIGNKPVGYGWATETEYVTVEVKDCTCGHIILEEYKAKEIDYKMADYILRKSQDMYREVVRKND